METDLNASNKRKSNVAFLSVISNTCLVILKLIVGVAIGSVSIISEAVHSGVDLIAAVIALLAVLVSGRPADENHPFGHGKVENISGTVEALLIFLAAGWIIFEAIEKLRNPRPLDKAGLGVVVMFISVITNFFVSNKLFQVGKETDSVALRADAWHLRTDIYTSLGVMIGLALIVVGEWIFPNQNLQWLDPVMAIGVALLIIRTAYHLTIESGRDLVDAGISEEEVKSVRKHIMAFAPTIRGFHRLRTRKAGANRFVDFHMRVDASMSIDESHRIADMVTCSIKQHYPGTTVTIHIEPCDCSLAKRSACGCLLSEEERRLLGQAQVDPSG